MRNKLSDTLTSLRLAKDSQGLTELMLSLERDGGCSPMQAVYSALKLINDNRGQKKKATWMTTARFPSWANSVTFDPKLCCVPTKKLEELMDLQWLVRGENLLMNGPTGLGKSLLSVILGKRAVLAGYRTFFIEEKAMNERLLDKSKDPASYKRQMQHFLSQDLLIIDDVGRVGDRTGGFCEVLHERHGLNKSTIITTNFPMAEWRCSEEVRGDLKPSSERFLERAHNLHFQGASLRLAAYKKRNSKSTPILTES